MLIAIKSLAIAVLVADANVRVFSIQAASIAEADEKVSGFLKGRPSQSGAKDAFCNPTTRWKQTSHILQIVPLI